MFWRFFQRAIETKWVNAIDMQFMCLNRIVLLGMMIAIVGCEKRAVPPEANHLMFPQDIRFSSNASALTLYWKPVSQNDVAGYKIYFGTNAQSYSDTIVVGKDTNSFVIDHLAPDQQYFCALSTVDINQKESELSEKIMARTYIAFEDFSQGQSQLDTTKWHYEPGCIVPITQGMVGAADIQFNDVKMRRSFGQYLAYTPLNNFAVDCQFMLGVPNVGGAGLMIRSELARPDKYYKGYNAFLFWNLTNWELRLEESAVDRYAMKNPPPMKIPDIRPDEWVKLTVSYKNGFIEAMAFRLSDYSVLGSIAAVDSGAGKRPNDADKYCGFFTTQYGGNVILADNFGIRRLD